MVGDRLRTYWLSCGTSVRPGASAEQIATFERRHGVLLPYDVRDYFIVADGMLDGDTDDCLISFWQLDRLGAAPGDLNALLQAGEGQRYFAFADYLIDSHHYVFRLSANARESGPVATTGVRSGGCIIAASFTDFVDLYLTPHVGEFSNRVWTYRNDRPGLLVGNAAELAVAPDAAQHRFARHPAPLRRAGEPIRWMPFGINSMTPFNYQRLCLLLVSLQLIGCAALSGRTVTFEGTSMLPTIKNGEKLVTEKLTARSTGKLKTGDIIVFKYPNDPSKGYIKRLIGMPGDRVEIRGEEVWVNGSKLSEPYVDSRLNGAHRSLPSVVVPPHSYYVLGDNRDNSSDSRIWGFVPEEMLISRVVR